MCEFKCNTNILLSVPRFSEPRFPPQGGPLSDFPAGEYGEPGFGSYSTRPDFPDAGMDRRPFPDDMCHHPSRGGDCFGPGGGRDSYGRSGLLEESPGRMYPNEYRSGQMGSSLMDRTMDKPLDRPGLMGAAPDSSNLSNTLLAYLVCHISHSGFLPKLTKGSILCF